MQEHDDDALSVKEADLAMLRRTRTRIQHTVTAENNLAKALWKQLGRLDQALQCAREMYTPDV